MKTKFTFFLCLACIFFSAPVLADDDCDQTLQDAKTAYNAGKYANAKKLYDYVIEICGPSYGNAASWSRKCQDALTPKLSVSRSNISVGAGAGTTSITVTSNRSWQLANTSSSLFTVTRNGDNITIKYSANPNTSSRSDYFDVKTEGGEKSVRVSVTQEAKVQTAPYISVSKTSITASSSGTTETLTVSSNTTWEVQYPSGTMYSVTRSGNTLTVKIEPNTSSDNRTDFFNVKTTDGSKVQKISLSQPGRSGSPYISVSKTSISASSYGKTETITVSSNTTWEVQYPSGTMYSVSRSGNTLTVKIEPNTSSSSRSDYFNVKTTDGSKVQKISLTQTGTSGNTAASATIHKVWVDHNEYVNGRKGMRIHVSMNAVNLKGKQCRAVAYFYTNSGSPLKDTNDSYCTTDGNVSCGENFTPIYDNSRFDDFELFMPYSELHITYKGEFKLFVNLWDKSISPSGDLAESDWVYFTYTP